MALGSCGVWRKKRLGIDYEDTGTNTERSDILPWRHNHSVRNFQRVVFIHASDWIVVMDICFSATNILAL
jgi:hypothetical protein